MILIWRELITETRIALGSYVPESIDNDCLISFFARFDKFLFVLVFNFFKLWIRNVILKALDDNLDGYDNYQHN